jgi:hypothetical protein
MRDAAGGGDVTNLQITRQIAVLNRDYAQVGVSFDLIDTSRYDNTVWHEDGQSAQYRSLTRVGGARALNIWLVDMVQLGMATFPWDYPRQGAVDGIRVNYESLPGGSIIHFNEGGTATHETGHWLGLFHTFQGGCGRQGDLVADTAAEAEPSFYCETTRDTCTAPGRDPVRNFMDYSEDACMNLLTRGQVQRMDTAFMKWRM